MSNVCQRLRTEVSNSACLIYITFSKGGVVTGCVKGCERGEVEGEGFSSVLRMKLGVSPKPKRTPRFLKRVSASF